MIAAVMLSVSAPALATEADNASASAPAVAVQAAEGFAEAASNDRFTLYLNSGTAEFSVLDKASGKMWYSNPQLTEEQSKDRSSGLDKIRSQLSISFLDKTRNVATVNSYNAASKNGKFEISDYSVDGKKVGFITTYNFDKDVHSFKIPLAVSLTENGVKAELLFDKVEENGTSYLCTVELLPLFGAALPEDSGYLFVPDGSGAIVDYTGMADSFSDYEQDVYGADSCVDLDLRMLSKNEGIKMPVFGAKIGDGAYFAIITSGDANAKIKASSSLARYKTSSVWSAFAYRENDETGLVNKDSVSRTVRMADSQIASENPVVEYTFLSGENADYSGMAEYYRNYLTKLYSLEKLTASKTAPLLQFFGKTYSSENFFGIPIKKALAATTLDQVSRFYTGLSGQGVEQSKVFLYGFQNGGYQNKYVSKFKVDGKVGGKKGLSSLIETAGSSNVFMAFDMIHDYDYGGLFKGGRYAAAMNNVTVTKQDGLLSTGAYKGSLSWRLVTNKALVKYAAKLVKSYDASLGCGIVFENMGSEIYNDYSDKTYADREQYKASYMQLNQSATEKGLAVGSDGANIYMLQSSEIISEIPTSSSNNMLFTRSVPFYSMVLHGYVNMSAKPMNSVADADAATALCAQFGIMPTYRLTGVESNDLKNSNLSFLFNTGMTHWETAIVDDYNYINSFSDGLSDKIIVSHEYEGTLSITEYENGVKLVYNESESENVTYNGTDIAPKTLVRIG